MIYNKSILDHLLDDDYTKKILDVANDFKTITEISIEGKVPISTVYRRIRDLRKHDLVDTRGDIINGRRFCTYKRKTNYMYNHRNIKIKNILEIISGNPGLSYNQLKKISGYPNGTLSNCISNLLQNNKIIARRTKRRAWFFLPETNTAEINLVINLRKETTKKILTFLLEKKIATFKEIRYAIKKSPGTTSWSLTNLIEVGIIRRIHGIPVIYELTDRSLTYDMLKKVEPSMLDSLRDRFADTFSYL